MGNVVLYLGISVDVQAESVLNGDVNYVMLHLAKPLGSSRVCVLEPARACKNGGGFYACQSLHEMRNGFNWKIKPRRH